MQNHRKDYAFGQVYPLITYKNTLLPFQVVLSKTGISISKVLLYNFNDGSYTDITSSMKSNGLAIKTSEGLNFSLLEYPGILPVPEIKYEGRYYLYISFSLFATGEGVSAATSEIELAVNPQTDLISSLSIYSDVFTVCNRVEDYLLLEYSNSYNFEMSNGVIDFSGNFKFRCYLNTQIGKPEYNFGEEATERLGYTFVESQVSKKVYKFTFLAPEYLCDALRIVRLCDNKQVTSKGRTYSLTTFSMEPEWEEQGDLASVECEFETDTVIANIGGYSPKVSGDFNSDYNSDFNNE